MRSRSTRLMVISVLLSTAAAGAADLHFIMFADTLDPTIGTGQDLTMARSWAQVIAANTGLNLRLQTLSGQDLTPANGRRVLSTLNPAADDVVYFVYSGHGDNAGNSQWPRFTFLMYTGDPYITFDEVVSTLQPKSQRLLIVISDCCNVGYNDSGRPAPNLDPAGQSALAIANFQRLFLDFRGTVLATAASKGQYSLGDSSEGGLFLNIFLEDFDTLASSEPALTWAKILGEAAADTTELASLYVGTGELGDIAPQEPHYTINEEQVAGETPDTPTDTTGDNGTNTDSTSDPQTSIPLCGAVGFTPLMALGLWWMVRGRRSLRL